MTDTSIETSIKRLGVDENELLGYLIRKKFDLPPYSKVWLKGNILHEIAFQGRVVNWKAVRMEISVK